MKVSVIIPVYNGAEFLVSSMRSIMEQSYRDLEIIVVDDGSTDNSYEIAQKLAEEDNRIQIIRQENSGVSAARNNGIAQAKGEYITFVDADDLLVENAVEVMVDAAKTGADLVIGSHEEFRGNNRKTVIHREAEYSYEKVKKELAEINRLMQFPWGRLYKRVVIVQNAILFDRTVPFGEDHIFNLQYCRHAEKIVVCDKCVYKYRLGGPASSVKYYPDKCLLSLALLDAYCAFCGGKDNLPDGLWNRFVRDGFVTSATHYLVHCKFSEAVERTQECLALYAPYLNEDTVNSKNYSLKLERYVLQADAKNILRQLYKEQFKSVVKKKIKKLYYRFFTKRI